ncbi:MAG: hypothetical protein Q4G46_14840 [Propionibacteriaceae bacterium]|nr:hypothetical protein [Propionibacteriaceae bacterium]
MLLTVLEGSNHLPVAAPFFGLIALIIALIGLAWVLLIGASRPHS